MKILKKKMPEHVSTIFSFTLIAVLGLAYFVLYRPHAPTLETAPAETVGSAYSHPLSIGNADIKVAYAVTSAEQEKGLSGTTELALDNGMLFIFSSDSSTPFWMKDMQYPLDIIWIGSDKTVKDISANLKPESYPENYGPKVPVRYVLEVPAGFAKVHKITIGMKVSF